MIEEDDIQMFPSELQDEIRKKIRQRIEKGYQLRHLALSKDGTVYLDYEQIEMDADSKVFGYPLRLHK
jgi:hypothetical protein